VNYKKMWISRDFLSTPPSPQKTSSGADPLVKSHAISLLLHTQESCQ